MQNFRILRFRSEVLSFDYCTANTYLNYSRQLVGSDRLLRAIIGVTEVTIKEVGNCVKNDRHDAVSIFVIII